MNSHEVREQTPYLKDLANTKDTDPLTHEEETRLSESIKKGNLEARNKLVRSCLWYVVSVANQYQYRGLSQDELISAGNDGLITAAERFDSTKGFKFISYAVWWIRQAILQALVAEVKVVRCPANHIDLISSAARIEHILGQELGRRPTLEETASVMGISVKRLGDVLASTSKEFSLDKSLEEEDPDSNLMSVISNTEASPDTEFNAVNMTNEISEVIAGLGDREAQVVRLYFGLDDPNGEGKTLEEIGERLGITRERVRQIKEKALQKLHHPSRLRLLKKYVET